MENKIQLSKKDRMSVALRHQFLRVLGTTSVCRTVVGHSQ